MSDFKKFLCVQKNLSGATVDNHLRNLKVFQQSNLTVQEFMEQVKITKSNATYKNYLSVLKILFRDFLKQPEIIEDFKFPTIGFKPKILPNKKQLITFYDALPLPKYRIIFMMLGSSGVRVSELLGAKIDNAQRMIIPQSHDGSTKNAWISFYNEEAAEIYDEKPFNTSRNTISHVFKDVADKTGINMSAQTLRSVFAREMSKAGVQDRYIDCFCGRTPQSVLARHYSDYSPEVLKEIYSKANIKILG